MREFETTCIIKAVKAGFMAKYTNVGFDLWDLYRLYFYDGIYSKTCVKRPLKNRQFKDLNDKW